MVRLGWGVVASLALSGAALAQGGRAASATFDKAPPATNFLVIDDFRWRCDAQGCSGGARSDRAGALRTCRELARRFGPVASFTVAGEPATAAVLENCNAAARR